MTQDSECVASGDADGVVYAVNLGPFPSERTQPRFTSCLCVKLRLCDMIMADGLQMKVKMIQVSVRFFSYKFQDRLYAYVFLYLSTPKPFYTRT